MTLTTQPPTRTTPQPGPRDHPRTRAHTGTADLRALAAGEPDAWTAVIARYQPLVASRARRQHLNPDDTADLMQDTWLRLFENADKVRDPERLPGWVATTASREAFKTRQRSFREQTHADA